MPPATSSDTTKYARQHAWSTASVMSGSTSGGNHDHHHQRNIQQQHNGQPHSATRKEADAATVRRWLDTDQPAPEVVLDRVARAFAHAKDSREGEAKTKTKMKL